MGGQFIVEHLMTDFAKDKVLAMKLSFGVDIYRGQQDRPVRQRIPTLAIREQFLSGGNPLKCVALTGGPQAQNQSYPYEAGLIYLHAQAPSSLRQTGGLIHAAGRVTVHFGSGNDLGHDRPRLSVPYFSFSTRFGPLLQVRDPFLGGAVALTDPCERRILVRGDVVRLVALDLDGVVSGWSMMTPET